MNLIQSVQRTERAFLVYLNIKTMTFNIPSTTVKSKYLKSSVFQDPRNDYSYQVVERDNNSTLSKAAVPYLGKQDPIIIAVPDKYLKLENPKRANIMAVMKQRITELEQMTNNSMNSKWSLVQTISISLYGNGNINSDNTSLIAQYRIPFMFNHIFFYL